MFPNGPNSFSRVAARGGNRRREIGDDGTSITARWRERDSSDRETTAGDKCSESYYDPDGRHVLAPNGVPRLCGHCRYSTALSSTTSTPAVSKCVANYVAILAILEPNRFCPGLPRDTVNCQQVDPSRASCPAGPSVARRANSCPFPPTRPGYPTPTSDPTIVY